MESSDILPQYNSETENVKVAEVKPEIAKDTLEVVRESIGKEFGNMSSIIYNYGRCILTGFTTS